MKQLALVVLIFSLSTMVNCQTIEVVGYPEIVEYDYSMSFPQKDGSIVFCSLQDTLLYKCDNNFSTCESISSPSPNRLENVIVLEGGNILFDNGRIYLYNASTSEWIENAISTSRYFVINDKLYSVKNNVFGPYNFETQSIDTLLDFLVYDATANSDKIFIRGYNENIVYNHNWEELYKAPKERRYVNCDSDIEVFLLENYAGDTPSSYPNSEHKIYVSHDNGDNFSLAKTLNGDGLTKYFVLNGSLYFRYLSHQMWHPWQSTRQVAKFGKMDLQSFSIENRDGNGLNALVQSGNDVMQRRANSLYRYKNGNFDQVEKITSPTPDNINSFTIDKIRTSINGDLFLKSEELLYRYNSLEFKWDLLFDGRPILDFDISDQDKLLFISDEKIWSSDDLGISYYLKSEKNVDPIMITWVKNNTWFTRARNSHYYQPTDTPCFDCWSGYPYLINRSNSNGTNWVEVYNTYHPSSWDNTDFDYQINSDNYFRGENYNLYEYYDKNTIINLNNGFSRQKANDLYLTNNDLFFFFSDELFYSSSITGPFISAGSYPNFFYVNQGVEKESIALLKETEEENELFIRCDFETDFIYYSVERLDNSNEKIKNIVRVEPHIDQGFYFITSDNQLFKQEKFKTSKNIVQGEIYFDKNDDCNVQENEEQVELYIEAIGQTRTYKKYSSEGKYKFTLPDGEYSIRLNYDDLIYELCPEDVLLSLKNDTIVHLDFGLFDEVPCERLTLSLNTPVLNYTENNSFTIQCNNTGNVDLESQKLNVYIDPFFKDISFNELATTIDSITFTLNIPPLKVGEYYENSFSFSIDSSAILGQTHCVNLELIESLSCDETENEQSYCMESISYGNTNGIVRRILNEDGETDIFFDLEEWIYISINGRIDEANSNDNILINEIYSDLVDPWTLEIISSSHQFESKLSFDNEISFRSNLEVIPCNIDSLECSFFINFRIKSSGLAKYGDEWRGQNRQSSPYYNSSNYSYVKFRDDCGEQGYESEEFLDLCDGSYYEGISKEGRYKRIYTDQNGCDSIVFINVTILPSYYENLGWVRICEGEEFYGETEEGYYTIENINQYGCDSTIRFTIRIDDVPDDSENYFTLCEDNSLGYNQDTVIIDTFTTWNSPCEYYTFNIYSVLPREDIYEEHIICEGQSVFGFSTTGIHEIEMITDDGCLFTHTVDLFVVEEQFSEIEKIICKGESFEGYTEDGIYYDTFTLANDCDSTRVLLLSVAEGYDEYLEVDLCEGENYNGITQSGDYLLEYETEHGCDSIIHLTLEMHEHTFEEFEFELCYGESYMGYTENGTYFEEYITNFGCDSIVQIIIQPYDDPLCDDDYSEGKLFSHETDYVIIYPNPFVDVLNVELLLERFNPASITIYDIHGHLIYERESIEKFNEINTTDFISGSYILKVQSVREPTILAKII